MDGIVYMAIGVFLMVTATVVTVGIQLLMRKRKREIQKKYQNI